MSNKSGILLIHGAGLGSFIWDEIDELLNHPTLAIDFPNREVGDQSNGKIPFEEYTDCAIKQIENWNIKQFTIVAHSIGGCLGLKLSDHFRDNVIGFVGIGAVIPKSNQSFVDCLPFPQKLILPFILKIFGTRPPDKSIEKDLCNDLGQSRSAEIIKRFSPESIKLYTSKVHYDPLTCDSVYLNLTDDRALSQSVQNEMIKNLNPSKVIELKSGHLPMLAKPEELANILNSLVSV